MRLSDKIMLIDLNKFMRSRGLNQSFLDARQAKTQDGNK